MFTQGFILVISLVVLSEGAGWDYVRGGAEGPANWPGTCASGTAQSPINIVQSTAGSKPIASWTMNGWGTSMEWTVENNGHSAQFTPFANSMTTTGGGLDATYILGQFHFHWGPSNTVGSEHTVDGKHYPLEVHLVHYKNTHASIGAAVASGASDDLAVLGFFFKIDDGDNESLAGIVEGIGNANVSAGSTTGTVTLGSINDIFEVSDDDSYYRYLGGLTTPGCNEVVAWTVFKEPLKISQAQMDAFRQVNTNPNTDLYRPVQALNGRMVYLYGGESSASSMIASALLVALTTTVASLL